MKIPDKEQIVPKIRNFEINSRHQANTLTLQDDDGYKYASVVVDTTTRLSDARPMKSHTSKTKKSLDINLQRQVLEKAQSFRNRPRNRIQRRRDQVVKRQ
jgi:hypothetical protein